MRNAHKNLEQQFISIYNKEVDAIFRYCIMRTSNKEIALDLTQDTFLRFWNALVEGKEMANQRAFLFTIARNLIIDWYRKKKTLSIEALTGEDGEEMDFAIEGSTKEMLERNADGRYLAEKISQLDLIYRHVVYLRFVEDMKPQEIAKIIGESVNVVSVRISRGLDKLRELIENENDK